jgi:hypothetical protein
MKLIQIFVGEYEENNIYNINKTDLYWRRSSFSGLFTQSRAVFKKNKSRISVILYINITDIDRLPFLFIEKFKISRALRYVNILIIEIVWKSNKKV